MPDATEPSEATGSCRCKADHAGEDIDVNPSCPQHGEVSPLAQHIAKTLFGPGGQFAKTPPSRGQEPS